VLLAMEESHRALVDYLNGLNAIARQERAVAHQKSRAVLAKSRFDSGLSDMTDYMAAQADLARASLELITRKSQTALSFIDLQDALAPSARAPAPDPTAPEATQ